ncbi:cache domain-containing protein [Aeromicrobium sp. A1-2]|uniref:cache domain-containing protein n=1 Tax=Aeromicrobium sp. A1-2 TaxID=2107713 RepID=UPI0020B1214B|nr:cache domain-containing protein [Aeromicrobium sp. A1-2]
MITSTTALADCVDAVESHFHRILDELETMRAQLVELFDRGPVDSDVARARIEPHVRTLLDTADVVGAGYVAARGALSDQPLYLAWWQGDDQHLLAEADAPATGDPLDYTRHPWFRTPQLTGRPHVTGPYVDFVCTDEYVMTTTVPVISHGTMVGVVGADTLVETLEALLLPILRSADATLVNDQGRAAVSSDPHLATGSLMDLSAYVEIVPCRGLPMSVVRR